MGDTVRGVFGVMRDKQQLRRPFANQHINEAAHQLAVERVQPLQRFVKDQQSGVFDQGADDQRQPLLPPGEAMERRIGGAFVDTQNIQPVLHQLMLLVRYGLTRYSRCRLLLT